MEVVRYLCEFSVTDKRIKPGAEYNYAIKYAAKNGHLEVVRYLCEFSVTDKRIKPEAEYNYVINAYYAINHAAKNGHSEVAKYLSTFIIYRYIYNNNVPLFNECLSSDIITVNIDQDEHFLRTVLKKFQGLNNLLLVDPSNTKQPYHLCMMLLRKLRETTKNPNNTLTTVYSDTELLAIDMMYSKLNNEANYVYKSIPIFDELFSRCSQIDNFVENIINKNYI